MNSGQPIRYERVESRFKPLGVDKWTKQFYAAPIDFGGGVPGSQPEPLTDIRHRKAEGPTTVGVGDGITTGMDLRQAMPV